LVQVGHFGAYCAPAHKDLARHEPDLVGWPWINHSRVAGERHARTTRVWPTVGEHCVHGRVTTRWRRTSDCS
jgi:hypothetical protein